LFGGSEKEQATATARAKCGGQAAFDEGGGDGDPGADAGGAGYDWAAVEVQEIEEQEPEGDVAQRDQCALGAEFGAEGQMGPDEIAKEEEGQRCGVCGGPKEDGFAAVAEPGEEGEDGDKGVEETEGVQILIGAKMGVAEDYGERSESRGCAEEGRSVQAAFFAA